MDLAQAPRNWACRLTSRAPVATTSVESHAPAHRPNVFVFSVAPNQALLVILKARGSWKGIPASVTSSTTKASLPWQSQKSCLFERKQSQQEA